MEEGWNMDDHNDSWPEACEKAVIEHRQQDDCRAEEMCFTHYGLKDAKKDLKGINSTYYSTVHAKSSG